MATLSSIHSGSYLLSATANPFTIALTGQIDASAGYALSLNSDTTWYVLNQGLVTVNSGDGIDLVSGTIANQGSIGGTNGVVISGTGSVLNQGVIAASSVGVTTDVNGTLYVSNASSAVISGGFLAIGPQYSTGTVVNAGTLSGGVFGVYANAGLTLTNTGTILGGGGDGIKADQGTIDITNAAGGYIHGYYEGIYLGGAAYGTVVNAGIIAHGPSSTDAIGAPNAGDTIVVVVDPGAVFLGTVAANAHDSLIFAAGTAAGTFSGLGAQYIGFGSYTVDAGASWTAASTNSFNALTVAGTLANAGTASGSGVFVAAGGVFDNLPGGTLSSAGSGVLAAAGATVVDAGIIVAGTSAPGTYQNAVSFGPGAGSTMVLYPGFDIVGTVDGGNTIGGAYGSTLELGSGAAAGTLDGLNTQFTNFASIYLDSGATWSLGGDVTIRYGQSLLGSYYSIVGIGATLVNLGFFKPGVGLAPTGSYVYNAPYTGKDGYLAGNYGVIGTLDRGAADTIVNAGFIYGEYAAISIAGYGALAQVTNLASGTIGKLAGITMSGGLVLNEGTLRAYGLDAITGTDDGPGATALTVLNSGSIKGANHAGIYLTNGGYISNAGTGVITAAHAIYLNGYGTTATTIVNAGTVEGTQGIGGSSDTLAISDTGQILGTTIGVQVTGETLSVTIGTNGYVYGRSAGIQLSGGRQGPGLDPLDNATVVVAGTIAAGVTGDAALFAQGVANRLVVDPGATFYGAVDGGNAIGATVASTLELGAGNGTLAGFGTTVFDFAAITLDPGANWLLAGTAYGLGGGETISGFNPGSTLELTGTIESYTALAGGELTLSGGTTLDLPGVAHAAVTNDGSNTFITACFASGTKIAGRFGSVPVEALREGDLVRTARGRLAPVRWIGFRRTDLARHPHPLDVMPVRVHAHAFGPSLPSRDLVLSPDHAVFVRGRLIPIRYLINNVSIVQETRATITYWHVELDEHDIILAEDLPCESYLDTGNRNAFANAPGAVQMTPDFARGVWAMRGCAPIITNPADPILRLLHTKLMARALRAARAA